MQVISSTDFRKNIPQYLQEAQENWEPIAVKTQKATGIFISLDFWNSLNETEYLCSTKKNTERLRKAKKETTARNFQAHNLVEA